MENDNEPLSRYLGRHICKFYLIGQSNSSTIFITVQNENFKQNTDLKKKNEEGGHPLPQFKFPV